MPATQFSGEALSNRLTSKVGKCNPKNEKFRLFSSLRRDDARKFVAFTDKKDLSQADVVGGCSDRHRILSTPLVTHRRKLRFPVVGDQLNSDCGVSSSEVEERFALPEELVDYNAGDSTP